MIVVIDYGLGNLGSIRNMLQKCNVESCISCNKDEIYNASKLILPGVGAFDSGMKNLFDFKLIDVLNEKVLKKHTPILGVCLGMQLFSKKSEEGSLDGLGWIDSVTRRFDQKDNPEIKVPHMGWNYISTKKESKLLYKLTNEETRFYFVHSYYVENYSNEDILATTNYGFDFTSMVENNNIFGVQFHPEKSHIYGKQLLMNFVEL